MIIYSKFVHTLTWRNLRIMSKLTMKYLLSSDVPQVVTISFNFMIHICCISRILRNSFLQFHNEKIKSISTPIFITDFIKILKRHLNHQNNNFKWHIMLIPWVIFNSLYKVISILVEIEATMQIYKIFDLACYRNDIEKTVGSFQMLYSYTHISVHKHTSKCGRTTSSNNAIQSNLVYFLHLRY